MMLLKMVTMEGYEVNMIDINSKIVSVGLDTKEQPKIVTRPQVLEGNTYKIKDLQTDHNLYITINNHIVAGKERPFEIFINSKNMDHFAWVVALTRVVSAVFRQSTGDLDFLIEELTSVFDPRGGYWRDGRYIPSVVADIGECIRNHLTKIGCVEKHDVPTKDGKAGLCPKCSQFGLVKSEGCESCNLCGYSKCS